MIVCTYIHTYSKMNYTYTYNNMTVQRSINSLLRKQHNSKNITGQMLTTGTVRRRKVVVGMALTFNTSDNAPINTLPEKGRIERLGVRDRERIIHTGKLHGTITQTNCTYVYVSWNFPIQLAAL